MTLLFDVALPISSEIAAGTGIGLAIVISAVAAIAYIAFRIFRKTMKMAFRMAVLAAVLIFAIGGSVGLWWFGTSKPAPRAVPQKSR